MNKLKLNIGCASRIMEDYVNIDLSTIEEIISRYPNIPIKKNIPVYQHDIFNLPYENQTVDEVRSDSMLEHLSFKEEKLFFYEVKRVLKSNGLLVFSVPDFEKTIKDWLEASDDWQDFYRDDVDAIKDNHWFGTYSYSFENRWGYLMASIFGPQNSEGQFHKNAYTETKIVKMMDKLDFSIVKLDRYLWKGDRNLMLHVEALKK